MARPELHVLTHPSPALGRTHADVVAAALRGGADVIQFRDKTLAPAARIEVALPLRELTAKKGATFVVNDHLALALRLQADGLHVGPDDLPVVEARALWPGILGASARDPGRARELERGGADYLGTGPVYGTRTKPGAPPPIGVDALARVVQAVSIPVIAIGGIDASNAAAAIDAGAAGVAVISSVVEAADVEAAVRALREAIDSRSPT